VKAQMDLNFLLLFLIFFFAYGTLALAGFGSTVLILSAASVFMPVKELMAPIIVLNVATIIGLVVTHPRELDFPLIKSIVFPRFLIMFPIGFAIYQAFSPDFLRLLLALLVIGMAVHSLYLAGLRPEVERGKASVFWLYLAGLVHGLFVSGGPFLVYYTSRLNLSKEKFRISLLFIWLALDFVLLAGYAAFGQITVAHLLLAAKLLPAALVGLVIGDRLQHRIPQARFLLFIDGLLLLLGVVLLTVFFRR
jgi:uncharacterized protein